MRLINFSIKNQIKKSKRYKKQLGVFITILVIIISLNTVYLVENEDPVKGKVDFQIQYKFQLKNEGPLGLSFVSLRLALLKDWDQIQTVKDFEIVNTPNKTTTDEYTNEFAWYEFDSFGVNQTLDLTFKANLSLSLLDYTRASLPNIPFNTSNEDYKLYSAYNSLEDTTDPAIQSVAASFESKNNTKDLMLKLYNFSSTYLRYKLLSSIRGASFALRNGYGDCDEYTSLFIALARARGIPAIEHTAWLADFVPGLETTDEGAAAHAYPMFYLEGLGMLPVDPTRGHTSLFNNFLKTDEKRITLTRGPDQPYRLLRYRWTPVEGVEDPLITSNYTIKIISMNTEYYSYLRTIVLTGLIGFPVMFIALNVIKSKKIHEKQKEKIRKMLSPDEVE